MHRAKAMHKSGRSGFGKHQLSQARLCNSAQTLCNWVVNDDAFMRCYAQVTMYGIASCSSRTMNGANGLGSGTQEHLADVALHVRVGPVGMELTLVGRTQAPR